MLLTHEEKEISYPVSLVIFTGEGKTTPVTDRSWLSKNCQSQRRDTKLRHCSLLQRAGYNTSLCIGA